MVIWSISIDDELREKTLGIPTSVRFGMIVVITWTPSRWALGLFSQVSSPHGCVQRISAVKLQVCTPSPQWGQCTLQTRYGGASLGTSSPTRPFFIFRSWKCDEGRVNLGLQLPVLVIGSLSVNWTAVWMGLWTCFFFVAAFALQDFRFSHEDRPYLLCPCSLTTRLGVSTTLEPVSAIIPPTRWLIVSIFRPQRDLFFICTRGTLHYIQCLVLWRLPKMGGTLQIIQNSTVSELKPDYGDEGIRHWGASLICFLLFPVTSSWRISPPAKGFHLPVRSFEDYVGLFLKEDEFRSALLVPLFKIASQSQPWPVAFWIDQKGTGIGTWPSVCARKKFGNSPIMWGFFLTYDFRPIFVGAWRVSHRVSSMEGMENMCIHRESYRYMRMIICYVYGWT